MECWLAKIPNWIWWDIFLVGITAITTWLGEHFRLSKKLKKLAELKLASDRNFEAILDEHIIADLKFIEEYMDWWEDNQRPDGKVDFLRKGRKNAKKLLEFPTLLAKHRDWIRVDYAPEERARGISLDASNSIDAIRRYGHKKAKEIRKKELENP